jgi:hypothetical protein
MRASVALMTEPSRYTLSASASIRFHQKLYAVIPSSFHSSKGVLDMTWTAHMVGKFLGFLIKSSTHNDLYVDSVLSFYLSNEVKRVDAANKVTRVAAAS